MVTPQRSVALLLLAASETQVFNLSILLGEHRVVFVCRVANKKDVSKVGWAGLEFFFDLPLWVGEVGGEGAATWRERKPW